MVFYTTDSSIDLTGSLRLILWHTIPGSESCLSAGASFDNHSICNERREQGVGTVYCSLLVCLREQLIEWKEESSVFKIQEWSQSNKKVETAHRLSRCVRTCVRTDPGRESNLGCPTLYPGFPI
jgi:hypothetical protein